MSAGSPEEAGWTPDGGDDAVVQALRAVPGTVTADGLPAVRVVRGEPDEIELAALVAGIVAHRAATDHEEAPRAADAWGDHGRLIGAAAAPGPGTWRWSARR
ncbi:acyl-CoA carboxylase subunit epsilon [Georgenia sp. 10Sc9-8]|uniref:Acyl-CoA carboxylase subunit epsilon n=1 Tax=Georgenia halotolerans TaxID=3028317 RepID=A0ABT5U0N7_9MICO|nr:acyl-CoA carboxylase subunit epsilon [Georgenia halotolerans]